MSEKTSVISEFWVFLREEKKWWLIPLVTVMLLLGVVIVAAEGSAIAPFIYSLI
jgi:hypothetical protein